MGIARDFAERDVNKARNFLSDARDTIATLADSPLLGSSQPQVSPRLHSMRRFRVHNHRALWVYYRPFASGNGIEVFAVLHERQDAATRLEAALEA